MVDLSAKSPCDGMLPVSVGSCSLSEEPPTRLTLIAPYARQEVAVSAAMEAAHGLAFPAPNRTSSGSEGARAVWFGRGQALLMGPEASPGLAEHAALTDISDGWAVVRLEGDRAEDVLARLVPLDLRPQVFEPGYTARTELRHMMASLTRVSAKSFQIMVFRSFAQTLVHDVKTAMEAVAARG